MEQVTAMDLVSLALGVALGAIAIWALMRRYRVQLVAREAELARLNERLDATVEQHRRELAAVEERVELVRGDRDQLRRDVQAVSGELLRKTGEAPRARSQPSASRTTSARSVR
jgi:uncharacterized membrane-anchored protein YhcB (DUF1043 family)